MSPQRRHVRLPLHMPLHMPRRPPGYAWHASQVIELGAGAVGRPSLVAAISGGLGTRVTITDKHPELVSRLRATIEANGLGGQCSAQAYTWGAPRPDDESEQGSLPRSAHDLILSADCLYSCETAGSFVEALEDLVGPNTRVLICCEERWSRRECLEILQDRGWTATQLGGARRLTATQAATIQRHALESGSGECFLYSLARSSSASLHKS